MATDITLPAFTASLQPGAGKGQDEEPKQKQEDKGDNTLTTRRAEP